MFYIYFQTDGVLPFSESRSTRFQRWFISTLEAFTMESECCGTSCLSANHTDQIDALD
jgi:hypothetical protein